MKHGYPVPDPKCTPGAFNPTVTLEILRDRNYRTSCARDSATKPREKYITYSWYGIPHPASNQGGNQTCELDHLVPLNLGGADTLDNIWPQCGPRGVDLQDRYFKLKDLVEDYLASMVKAGKSDLNMAQRCIAADWPFFLEKARGVCTNKGCDVRSEPRLDLNGCGG